MFTAIPWFRRNFVTVLIFLGFLVILGIAGWYFLGQGPDMTAVMQTNNQGLGAMERFDYGTAVGAFESVIQLAPNWIPGQINLAIALINRGGAASHQDEKIADFKRAQQILLAILNQDPKNPYANFCTGIVYDSLSKQGLAEPDAGYPFFQTVLQQDPRDSHTWFYSGQTHPKGIDSAEALECFKKAVEINPYLTIALHALAQHPLLNDEARSTLLRQEINDLKEANWEDENRDRYGEIGKYASIQTGNEIRQQRNLQPVGPLPLFLKSSTLDILLVSQGEVKARWANPDDLDPLRKMIWERFGATMVLLDYDRDGMPDLLLLGALVDNKVVRDLLLHNEGGGKFRDTTKECGLDGLRDSLSATVADFDNDGWPDLLITCKDHPRLFRNGVSGSGRFFENVTAKAGFDRLTAVYLTPQAFDIDQDGDLDVLLHRIGESADAALRYLKAPGSEAVPEASTGQDIFINTGEAALVEGGQKPGPLSIRFRPSPRPADNQLGLKIVEPTIGSVLADVDGDHDVDWLVLPSRGNPQLILNDRLLRFHGQGDLPISKEIWNGGLVLNLDQGNRSSLLLLPQGKTPLLIKNRVTGDPKEKGEWFPSVPVQSPPLRQAQAIDWDLDGWTDVAGITEQGFPTLLHNDGKGRLVESFGLLGKPDLGKNNVVAQGIADFSGACQLDIMVWRAGLGLELHRNQGTGNHLMRIQLTGLRDKGTFLRTNADGIGSRVIAQVDRLYTSVENTTLFSGLGQSRLPLMLGLGRAHQADVVRIFWPDNVLQSETNVGACTVSTIREINRKGTSCPLLLTWNGEQFVYITDFLGAGSVGELGPDGSTRPPRPEESVQIESHQLKPDKGYYTLKIAEPLDEILYLDQLELEVVDLPPGQHFHPDERFATVDPQPTGELFVLGTPISPIRAVTHTGIDVTNILEKRDGKTVDFFKRRGWIGFAEDHFVELDFGDRLKATSRNDRWVLTLAGWIDYPYPESIYAASQAGVPMKPPVLECYRHGKWEKIEELGFPAGLPRVMTRELTNKLDSNDSRFRIRTNLQVFWDQIDLAPVVENKNPITKLPVVSAQLQNRGFLRQFSREGSQLIEFDDATLESVAIPGWTGSFTRLGEVGDLLQKQDDCFVVSGPGEEITVRFDSGGVPPLAKGWTRGFILKARGYSKDTAPFTATSGSVDPLPFKTMSNYPPPKGEEYPQDETHRTYRRTYQTRVMSR